MAVVLLSLTIVMFKNEHDHKVHMFTTADEDQVVYHGTKLWMMNSVCMVEDSVDSFNLSWVLFTASCNGDTARSKSFTIQGHTDGLKGYYFSFLKDSTVNISMYMTGTVHYLWTSNERKAVSMSDNYCGQRGHEIKVSKLTTFNHTGYYYICIDSEQSTSYQINVTEFYYHRAIIKECKNPVSYGSFEHKCCYFDFKDSFTGAHSHCVYLRTRNQQPDKKHMDKPLPVTVYMKYSEVVKTLTIVTVVALFVSASILIILASYHLYRARRQQLVQNN